MVESTDWTYRVPAPAFFVAGAVSQYVGAALAVVLFDRLAPAGVAWLRVTFSGLLLAAWCRPRPRGWTARHWRAVAAFGATLAAMNLCFYLAVDRLPLGTAVAIEFSGPVAVAAIGARSRRHFVALGLAAAGVLLMADVQWQASPGGVLLALAAAALWAGYIVLGRRVASEVVGGAGGLAGLTWSMLLGGLVIAPFGLPAVVGGAATLAVLVGCAAVGVLSNVIPYGLDQLVLARLSTRQFALLLSLLPATATIVGAVLLGQVPRPAEAAGIGLVVAAVIVGR